MDLNASPLPEDDDDIFQQHLEEDNAPEEHVEHYQEIEPVQPAMSFSRREREERMQRMKRQRSDDRPKHANQPPVHDDNIQNKRNKPFNRIPPGWVDCPASGQEICCMVPSKVPLSDSFNDVVPPGKRYSSKQVIHQQRVLGRKLGLIIDLTNTTRYYSTSDWNKEGIKHVKIACRGRDSVPDNESVNSFVYEVSQFLSRQKHSKKYILVHCTHGHNRTGFMIVHFLMRTRQISVSEAIQTFVNVRPPGIYKPDYIDALYAFYHERMLEGVVCPSTPDWKTSEFDLNGDAIPDDDDDGPAPSINERNQEQEQIVMSNDDILGDKIPDDQQSIFRQFCYQMLKLPGGRHAQFPGSHPVSLTRENLQLLRQRYYYATWKADGTRYMMLITMDGCYLIDRHFNFRRVQMRFPCRHPIDTLAERTHHFTLLDGEMIIDTVPDSRKQERRYLIYDMMAINSISVVEIPFNERFKMLEKEIIEPRNNERQHIFRSRNPCYYRYELEPFRVRRKDFWLLSTVTKLLKEFIPKLSHEADGLIFQGWEDPYVPRTHEGLLKWKYPEMNSVDFLFEINEERQCLYLYDRGKKRLLEGAVVFADDTDPSQFSGKIIECSWNSEENVWVCMRVRIDKGTPNEFNTYRKVMRSITDNITEEDLLGEINEIICLPMYVDKIHRDSKARRRAHG